MSSHFCRDEILLKPSTDPRRCSARFAMRAPTSADTPTRSSFAAFVSQYSSKNGCAARMAFRSSASFNPTAITLLIQVVNRLSGVPPWKQKSRQMSLQPSHGLIAARWGDCSAAANHWRTEKYDGPERLDLPIGPVLRSSPVDRIGVVPPFLFTQERRITLREPGSAGVGTDDGVTVGAPEHGVRTLEPDVARPPLVAHPRAGGKSLKKGLAPGVLAIRAPPHLSTGGSQRLAPTARCGTGRQAPARESETTAPGAEHPEHGVLPSGAAASSVRGSLWSSAGDSRTLVKVQHMRVHCVLGAISIPRVDALQHPFMLALDEGALQRPI